MPRPHHDNTRKRKTCPRSEDTETEIHCVKEKRYKSSEHEKPSKNCYTIECCDEKLIKSQQNLQSLIDCKRQLEDELDKSLDDIKCINSRIGDLECRLEKLMAAQAAQECQNRMKNEICMIKEERKKTEQDLQHYRRKLREKLERLKRCAGKDDNECN
ncbi:hypothetical protein QE152_g22404 [Popillia japonica]|uniref:Uncharacterized protein n=1 Tax=Popillia japonica TaxID=7064 RepID=A0AAW1KK95_POPJA